MDRKTSIQRKIARERKHKDTKDTRYAKRSFGFVKSNLKSLGLSGPTGGEMVSLVVKIVAIMMVLIFIMFHPIYLKTGTPMFKYGFSMMILPPFYFLWAVWKLISVYLLKMR